MEQMMVTTGAMSNRIDRLEAHGLVERDAAPNDRRKVGVGPIPAGLTLVDEVVTGHLETERRILEVLSPRQQQDLARHLRRVLHSLGGRPPRGD